MKFLSGIFFYCCKYCCLSFLFVLIFSSAPAQARTSQKKDTVPSKEFTVSYNIVIKGKKIDGIAETYNGGIKTAFVQNNNVRLRLVSLMRIQSIFFRNGAADGKVAAVVKESGADKTKFYLSKKNWKIYNGKYDSLHCELYEDTLTVLGRLCKKAVVTTKDGKSLTVYYFPGKKNPALTAAEPVFAGIPGLVMKYIYEAGDKSIEYTAACVSTKKISPSVFILPVKGYKLQRYRPGKPNIDLKTLNNDEDEEVMDDEEEE